MYWSCDVILVLLRRGSYSYVFVFFSLLTFCIIRGNETYDRNINIYLYIKTSDRTMALESIQPLTEMSTRSISWG